MQVLLAEEISAPPIPTEVRSEEPRFVEVLIALSEEARAPEVLSEEPRSVEVLIALSEEPRVLIALSKKSRAAEVRSEEPSRSCP